MRNSIMATQCAHRVSNVGISDYERHGCLYHKKLNTKSLYESLKNILIDTSLCRGDNGFRGKLCH